MTIIETLTLFAALISSAGFFAYAFLRLRGMTTRIKAQEEELTRERTSRETLERKLGEVERGTGTLRSATEEILRRVGELQERLENAEELANVMVPPRAVPNGLNITRRVEVQQRLREGASPEAISQELEVALSEVRLIAHLDRENSTPRRTKSGRSAQKAA